MRKIWRTQKGTSLIEVLLAAAILGLIGPAFVLAMSGTAKNTERYQGMVTASSLAQWQVEDIKASPYILSGDYSSLEISPLPNGYEIILSTDKAVPDNGRQEVTVEVLRQGELVLKVKTVKTDWG